MALTKVLISVKTYPTLSEKYDELVCTAGFLEDGSWIRIYPIPFRKLKFDSRYHKWQWIEIDLIKNTKDFRKESYRPFSIDSEINILDSISRKGNWAERRNIVLKNVRYNMQELIDEAQNPDIGTSLAVFKPKKIVNFIWKSCQREWDSKKLATVYAHQSQMTLFDVNETKRIFKIVRKLPYEFSYVFEMEDGKKCTLMIEDWEIGELYWRCLRTSNGNEIEACKKVKEKYLETFTSKNDLYFFLGTTKKFHNWSTNPFIIIGAFYPPLEKVDAQLHFDFD